MMKNKKNDYVLYGIIAALLTLLLGFGVLYLLWNLIRGDKELPGLFFYKAATYGDAICLTVLIGSMTAFVKYNEDVLLNKKLKCLIVAIICGLIGIIIQASWLISDTTLLNWTIPKQHYFNIAGWYHSLFFVGMFSVIGYLVSRIWFIVREKSSYIFIEKALMVLITSSSALYLLCHMEDDYYELVSNGISYGIVAVATIVIISCLFVNRFVKFSNVKIVIIDGLILAIGLYHSIVTRAFGNVSLSLAGAFSMIVYSGRDNVNLKKYILTNIPMFIGSFGIFFYITGCDNLAAKIGLAVVFIILLLIFDYNIIQGEKLNAIGILVSLYIVLFVIITNKDFLEIAPSVFTILMSLLFSKGIKNVFDDIIKAEQKKNRNLITNKEFKSIKMLAYIEIVSLVVSLILILWDWLKDIAIANNVDINWGELYIKNTSIVIVLIGIATMLLLGVRLVKSRIGIIVSLFVLVCEYLIILLNCYNNITNINFVDMSLITICVNIFAIFANVGGGLLLSHGFRMNVATLRLKPITRPINLISRIMGIGHLGYHIVQQ